MPRITEVIVKYAKYEACGIVLFRMHRLEGLRRNIISIFILLSLVREEGAHRYLCSDTESSRYS